MAPHPLTTYFISSAIYSFFVQRLPGLFLQQNLRRKAASFPPRPTLECSQQKPPQWPSKALIVQRRIPDKDSMVSPATCVTYWDSNAGANLVQITPDDGKDDVLWDLEFSAMRYYFTPSTQVCQPVIKREAGIRRENWLDAAQPLGESVSWDGDKIVCGWRKANFIDYYADKETGIPTRWYFYSMKATFEVLYYEPNPHIDEHLFQPPDYCLSLQPIYR